MVVAKPHFIRLARPHVKILEARVAAVIIGGWAAIQPTASQGLAQAVVTGAHILESQLALVIGHTLSNGVVGVVIQQCELPTAQVRLVAGALAVSVAVIPLADFDGRATRVAKVALKAISSIYAEDDARRRLAVRSLCLGGLFLLLFARITQI